MLSTTPKSASFALAAAFLAIPTWAGTNDVPGIQNFHQVNESVFRGAQPTEEGFQRLAKMGVKTIVDLRREDEHSTASERRMVEAAGMKYVNLPMQGFVAPHDAVISRVLAVLNNTGGGAVFVHCKRGADRTGGVIACYRISHDGWDNHKALKEAKTLGMRWTQFGIMSYIVNFHGAPVVADTETSGATR